ncbi:hypothetical protein IFM61606_05443 [Aspergillus udagawae]|uniref:F-box domain-containing protein n=1 Tax=Aspergillus udagawae TaxID=91492 RepID=A0ABQ1ARC7_9EURO|nr:hypothetical protein IFM53868_04866 [Aspergillus udagawae]GFG08562.1 hypothetical protein IFM5058_03987 [Aspergillus udagawae]GFG25499.1 hypothetical protein IFM61606_05443 [Aspergillus udagawae]
MAESQRLVLSTPELLEYVLLYLDVQSLLTSAQRVCRSWTRLIQTSPRLQQVLFFKPIPPERCPEKLINPLLARHFTGLLPASMDPYGVRDGSLRHPWSEQADRRQKFFRREASWRRMLVQQPPASLAYVETSHSHGDWIYKCYYLPCNASPTTHLINDQVQMDLIGLRMNMLYDLVLESCFGVLHRHWICWEGQMPPEFPEYVSTEQLTPFVERAMQEADVVVINHRRRRRRRRIASRFICYLGADEADEADEADRPVSPHTDPTPHLPIETLNRAGLDVSRDGFDPQSNQLSAFRLQYPYQDWGVNSNSTWVSGHACLELREEKFIPRVDSDDEE